MVARVPKIMAVASLSLLAGSTTLILVCLVKYYNSCKEDMGTETFKETRELFALQFQNDKGPAYLSYNETSKYLQYLVADDTRFPARSFFKDKNQIYCWSISADADVIKNGKSASFQICQSRDKDPNQIQSLHLLEPIYIIRGSARFNLAVNNAAHPRQLALIDANGSVTFTDQAPAFTYFQMVPVPDYSKIDLPITIKCKNGAVFHYKPSSIIYSADKSCESMSVEGTKFSFGPSASAAKIHLVKIESGKYQLQVKNDYGEIEAYILPLKNRKFHVISMKPSWFSLSSWLPSLKDPNFDIENAFALILKLR